MLIIGVILGAAAASMIMTQRLASAREKAASASGQLEELRRQHQQHLRSAQDRESVLEVLHPMEQGLAEMRRAVHQVERDSAAQHSRLHQQLTQAAQSDAQIIESTQALLGALHSTSARGHWGEVQLRRVVEAAGMMPHVDFTEQRQNASDDMRRPDMVIHLPGDRHLILDAKAPLHPTNAEAQARALRARVSELSKKRYWDSAEGTPEVVFCFIPAESLLSAALRVDPSLLDSSLAKGVALTSPASLLASLKAVESAWRQDGIARNVRRVIEHAAELHTRLTMMSGYLSETGQRITQTADAYNKLLGNIERRVLPQVEALSTLQIGRDDELDGLPAQELPLTTSPVTREVRPLGPRLENS